MEKVTIEVESLGSVSDGYHTIAELYEHRNLLFLAFCDTNRGRGDRGCWMSKRHWDGTEIPGWFLAGCTLHPGSPISYHLPDKLWDLARDCGLRELDVAPEWDGHTSRDVLIRIERFLELPF